MDEAFSPDGQARPSTPATPTDEPARLAALRRYRVLDTPPEESFDRITRLASCTLGMPIALISLVDDARQWFKSRCGLDTTETPREFSFCTHAIRGDDIFMVGDAAADPRFAANPLVTGSPNIRFYAGAPLRSSDGPAIGTLCVIDTVPRRFDAKKREILRALADQVVHELEIRSALGDLYSLDDGYRRSEQERRRAAEDELRRLATRNHLLAAAVEASSVGVTIVDLNSPGPRVAYVNAAFGEMTGHAPREFAGHDVSTLRALVSSPDIIAHIERTAAERRAFTVEMPLTRPDGSPMLTSTSLAPVFDEHGRHIAVIGLHTDITEREREQAAERERQKLLSLGQLAGGVAHEINNLLQPIMSLSELALATLDEATDPERRADLETVIECSRAARDIVRKILLFSRKDATVATACDLPAELRRALEFVRVLLPVGIAVEEDFTDAVTGVATINGGELAQVMTNLALNAGQAMGGRGTVTVGMRRAGVAPRDAAALALAPGEYFVLTVADTGCGMDDATAARIFEPFFTTKPQGQGTGLGLSVAYGILKNWGGSISVKTAVGRGATFILHIPVSSTD
jgi:PAS domain S-box-containing protein